MQQKLKEIQESGIIRKLTIRQMILQSAKLYNVQEIYLFNVCVKSTVLPEFTRFLIEHAIEDDEAVNKSSVDPNQTQSESESDSNALKNTEDILFQLQNFWMGQQNLQESENQSQLSAFKSVGSVQFLFLSD